MTGKPLIATIFVLLPACFAAEGPLLVTYTHQMEEPGNLEITTKNVTAKPGEGNRFFATATEFEYGVKGWWTTSVYLDGQVTRGESTTFTGYRWENRFRLLPREHWINPVLYLEFANLNGADKSLLEIVATDGDEDLAEPVHETRREKKRELEAKLILGSHVKNWTLAGNFIVEKNVKHEPYEFGYAAGVSRPLGLAARPETCNLCPENFQVGVEAYGGLGTHASFTGRGAAHYIAPVASWTLANGATFKVSPGFGVTGISTGLVLRAGLSYEIAQFGRSVRNLFTRGAR